MDSFFFLRRFWILLLFVILGNGGMTAASAEIHFSFRLSCPLEQPDCVAEPLSEDDQGFYLSFSPNNKPFDIDLLVKNPSAQLITSARAKLQYDPTLVEVLRIDTDASAFPLFAPGEKDIDREKGTVMLGGSLTSGSKSDTEFLFARMTVQPKSAGAKIEFLNFQANELGDTGVLYTKGIDTENLLKTAPKPLFFGKASAVEIPQPPSSDPVPVAVEVTPPSSSVLTPPCTRPQGFRLKTTEDGVVELLWPLGDASCAAGYFVYYGQKSGFYLRRRDVGRTNFVEIEGLEKDQRFCFALSSYSAENVETDYSDEACVIVGHPGTETHQFIGDPQAPSSPSVSYPPHGEEHSKTGSGELFFVLLISAGLALVGTSFRRRI